MAILKGLHGSTGFWGLTHRADRGIVLTWMGKRRPDNASALQTEFDAHHVRLSSHRLFRDHLTPGTTDRVGDDHPAALGVTDDQSGSLSVTEPQVQRQFMACLIDLMED